jgi:hypothetical protein
LIIFDQKIGSIFDQKLALIKMAKKGPKMTKMAKKAKKSFNTQFYEAIKKGKKKKSHFTGQ